MYFAFRCRNNVRPTILFVCLFFCLCCGDKNNKKKPWTLTSYNSLRYSECKRHSGFKKKKKKGNSRDTYIQQPTGGDLFSKQIYIKAHRVVVWTNTSQQTKPSLLFTLSLSRLILSTNILQLRKLSESIILT